MACFSVNLLLSSIYPENRGSLFAVFIELHASYISRKSNPFQGKSVVEESLEVED